MMHVQICLGNESPSYGALCCVDCDSGLVQGVDTVDDDDGALPANLQDSGQSQGASRGNAALERCPLPKADAVPGPAAALHNDSDLRIAAEVGMVVGMLESEGCYAGT